MKVYYSVTVSVYTNGKRSMHITGTKAAEKKPENTSQFLNDKNVYVLWYDSYEEAEASMKGEM